ncbi:MAG: hypothetical protein EBS87_11940 [Sphingomonadaceae bacterium]|nr:hypothetical protein [Sphingomonadaceae bacterium]NCA02848.1 hypothetical protein [Sphingomonadaceae bacterium]
MSNEEEVGAEPQQGEVPRMTEKELWAAAWKYHQLMSDEIENAGDMIGVSAVLFTNMLIAGVVSGLDRAMVGVMLNMIARDVEAGVTQISETNNTMQ